MTQGTSKLGKTGKVSAGLMTAVALVLSSSPVAHAAATQETSASSASGFNVEGAENRAELVEAANELSNYSERDVLKFLLAGTGPIAAANPGLDRTLGFHPDRASADPEALEAVIDAYNEFNPTFGSDHLPRLTSNDPAVFEKAVLDFYGSVATFLEAEVIDSSDATARGRVNVNNGVNVNVGLNVQVGLNVLYIQHAGAAVIAVAVALVFLAYLDGDSMSTGEASSLDQQNQLRDLRLALTA